MIFLMQLTFCINKNQPISLYALLCKTARQEKRTRIYFLRTIYGTQENRRFMGLPKL